MTQSQEPTTVQLNGHTDHTETTKETPHTLSEVLATHRGEYHAIVLHDYPDPDAIAAAFAHRLISAQFNIETDLLYAGAISHQQNIALVRLLGIDLVRYTNELDLSHYTGAVYVDNQGNASKVTTALEAAGICALIVVDHHEPQDRLNAEYVDVRRVGATATMYAEYLEEGLVILSKTSKEHSAVATALMHGIMSDTDNFIRAGVEDFHAAAFLSRFIDADLLQQILNQSRTKQTMESIRRALGNRLTVENYSIAGIGYLRAADRDSIPQAADFLLTEENIHTAIVYGIITDADGKEALIGSMRTTKLTLDPDAFIKEVLGRDASGNYFGGGKFSAGAFEIPIGFLSGGQKDGYQDLKWRVYDEQVKQRIFGKIGVEQGASNK
ncbi:MAG: bifunctional oligoribonuclease/PAP phosphatase NrnA [Caldilineaceae bacterium]